MTRAEVACRVGMTQPGHQEPPLEFIWYSLEEAKELLSVLDDAGRTLATTGHFAGVALIDIQRQVLRRKLELDGPDGGAADDI